MKYTIEDQNREMIQTDLDESQVQEAVEKAKVKYPEDEIFVSFSRSSDGQRGWLNPDGDHEISDAQSW